MHALSLEKELTCIGWQVSIVCLDTLPLFVRYLPHIAAKVINVVAKPLGYFYKDRITRYLYRFFIRECADLYVFEDIYLSWNLELPAITLLHAVWSDNLQAFDLTKKQITRLIKKESNVISMIDHPIATVSNRYRDYLCKTHFALSPLSKIIEVIELGLDTKDFPVVPQPKNGRALIYCGSLEARKNVSFMLDVFELVAAVDPEAGLTIIGDGPERIFLEKIATLRRLAVTFKGRQPHGVVISELQRHSIYLHTSLKESFSFALLEAKLCGLTTCALATLEVPESFIDLGFESFDAQEWAREILKIDLKASPNTLPDFSARRMAKRTLLLAGCASASGG